MWNISAPKQQLIVQKKEKQSDNYTQSRLMKAS